MPLDIIADSALVEKRVAHGFFTRRGGVSAGVYASLNCGLGSGDDPGKVAANRARAALSLAAGGRAPDLVTLRQVHGARAVIVETPFAPGAAPDADALATRTPGLALGILTADCAPICLADADAGVIAAAHAGWRGALDGIIEAALDAMDRLGAARARVVAAIGPCIAPSSYEVGPEFLARFRDADPGNGAFFSGAVRAGHYLFDLPGFCRARLERAGVRTVSWTGQDTLSAPDLFFSYRRATLDGEKAYGRGLSAIVLGG